MKVRFSNTPPNFWLAFLVAPAAGAIAAGATSLIFLVPGIAPEDIGSGIVPAAVTTTLVTLVITSAFTCVIGALVVLHVKRSGRIPSRSTAIAVGVIAGVLPFATCNGLTMDASSRLSELLFTPALALTGSIATSWTFWKLGLENRPARAELAEVASASQEPRRTRRTS
jgi:hypothetical protein